MGLQKSITGFPIMILKSKLGVVLLGVGLCVGLSACIEKKKPETVLKGEVGGDKISATLDMYEMAHEEKISTNRMNRGIRDEKERWRYADRRRNRWVQNAMESGLLDSEYTAKSSKKNQDDVED